MTAKQAADELCTLSQTERGAYPWLMQAASRLIVKHESEWANPSKWKQLIVELEKQTGPKQQHEEEQKRIEALTWWDEVKAAAPGFPASDVFHIHPIALRANFARSCDCAEKFKSISAVILKHEGGYVNNANDKGGPTNHGIAWNAWQAYAQEDLGIEPTLENLKNLTSDQAEKIYLKRYWEPKGFCKFTDMRVALMIYDWTITSGGAAKQIQNFLNDNHGAGIKVDGGMGESTVDALNKIDDQDTLLNEIADLRRQYYTNITVKNQYQIVFLKGWLNRVDDCLNVRVEMVTNACVCRLFIVVACCIPLVCSAALSPFNGKWEKIESSAGLDKPYSVSDLFLTEDSSGELKGRIVLLLNTEIGLTAAQKEI
ncbi:glycoside hydrolase family 108 protein [Caballeronia ptereochthonis]|uniref:EF hand domain-containing protein n=1 Tax=Caballeronia ptereochthonis TaxID=1777144 RepID=A0A158BVU5_9BURK|nr:glycosyl hydrolase 108 family protein [Caballeronia ptereochthonis]SAK74121.1 EF hand domain-containing protein [Caballeronia ptereochthonis]